MRRERKTIRLGSEYSEYWVKDGELRAIDFGAEDPNPKTFLKPGDKVVLVASLNLKTDETTYWWSKDLRGVPGNANPNIRKTKGWRGTTNDISVHALGIWEVEKIKELKRPKDTISIKLKKIADE